MSFGGPSLTPIDWELMWAPYDERTYQDALDIISVDDVVLDIGAGDLRFARRMAATCRQVYAVEVQERVINQYDRLNPLPDNLVVVHADARMFPVPGDVTTGVLLMRHCQDFRLYANRLKSAGARRLITNARWGLGVEQVDLWAERLPYSDLEIGGYACWCGETGFKTGTVRQSTSDFLIVIHEVYSCPECRYNLPAEEL